MSERSPAVERRQNLELRAIFDEAYVRLEPFLDPSQTWGGAPLTVLACHALREAYPQLSPEDVHTLIIAAKRLYQARSANTANRTAHPEPLVAAK